MSKRVVIVGCGQLGSRHLQAVAMVGLVGTIEVVDALEASLELGRVRLNEVEGSERLNVKWLTQISDATQQPDLVIVATQATGRAQLVEHIIRALKPKALLLEKVVTQSIKDYNALLILSQQADIPVWVNCKTRAYAIHQYIKTKLQERSIIFTRTAGNHGLGNNGIHSADLFCYYTDHLPMILTGRRIDQTLYPSKRGGEIVDVSGALYGATDRGDDFAVIFSGQHQGSDFITITADGMRFTIDHHARLAYEAYATDGYRPQAISLTERYEVSAMTQVFVKDIFERNSCLLPTLKECYPSHEFILNALHEPINKLLNKNLDYCPVT